MQLSGHQDHRSQHCDIFLWGHLKYKVNYTSPANTADLKERISYEVYLLKKNQDLVKRVMTAM